MNKSERRICISWSEEAEARAAKTNLSRSGFVEALMVGLTDTQIEAAVGKGAAIITDRRKARRKEQKELADVISVIPREELLALAKKASKK